jgi:ABC-type uncharacterized transport system substrate-binding protein
MMERRRFLVTSLAGAFAAPLVAWAQPPPQQPRQPIIGITLGGSLPNPYAEAFRVALAGFGWVDGQNVRIEYRYVEGRPERYPGFFAEFMRLNVNVIVAGGGTIPALAARQATRTTPIIVFVPDPVTAGLVASLARPGGNVTGLSMQIMEIGVKRLGLLKELVPGMERIGVFCDAADAGEATAIEEAASGLRSRVQILRISRVPEFEEAFEAAKRGRAQALILCASGFFTSHQKHLLELAARYRIPTIYEHRDFAIAGGLISYGPSIAEMYRSAATYTDKLLRGAKPSDLPIEQPTKFELVINLKTAKALGLTIPPSLLARADQVIE